jgi:hypothetical protein
MMDSFSAIVGYAPKESNRSMLAHSLECAAGLRQVGLVCRTGPKRVANSCCEVPLGKRGLPVIRRPLATPLGSETGHCGGVATSRLAACPLNRNRLATGRRMWYIDGYWTASPVDPAGKEPSG